MFEGLVHMRIRYNIFIIQIIHASKNKFKFFIIY